MPGIAASRTVATAAWRTWGARGLVRRAGYEAVKRSGRLRDREDRWTRRPDDGRRPLRSVGLVPQVGPPSGRLVTPTATGIELYGGLVVPATVPPDWHRHPLTGHEYPTGGHWSAIGDHDVAAGDVKDLWELGRLGWLHPLARHWASTRDDAAAELVWLVIEDWYHRNPPYRGPHWMCGQETSLRAISVMFLAEALDASGATTDERRLLVAGLVDEAVGRVAPTLGYALSQRNNHATSEAAFLWTASVLAPWLPGADRLRARSARALTEAVADQVAADGSHSQHSPTYHRVALHALLWCLAVARGTGTPAPTGVEGAVGRSVPHLRGLLAPGSDGRVPNLGGNDGALVFDLTAGPIGDLRPLLAHASAATDQASGLGPGPWDEEAAWFGLAPVEGAPRLPLLGIATHPLTRGTAHAVLRAGPLRHRPAHADQLHVDVWIGGVPVAADPGSYRYTAPEPWGNALSGEDVHNLPRVAGVPQAERAGRFFWRSWSEATVEDRLDHDDLAAITARLELPDGTTLRRLVAVADGVVVVVDRSTGAGATVRWNLAAGTEVRSEDEVTRLSGPTWVGLLVPADAPQLPVPSDDEPASGWQATTYAVREPCRPVLVPLGAGRPLVSVFVDQAREALLPSLVRAAAAVPFDRLDGSALERLVGGSSAR